MGAATKTRFLPLHTLDRKVGFQLCSIPPALHHLCEADYTSKVGTNSAVQANPDSFLANFAKDF